MVAVTEAPGDRTSFYLHIYELNAIKLLRIPPGAATRSSSFSISLSFCCIVIETYLLSLPLLQICCSS